MGLDGAVLSCEQMNVKMMADVMGLTADSTGQVFQICWILEGAGEDPRCGEVVLECSVRIGWLRL